jgi:hypothetical protein
MTMTQSHFELIARVLSEVAFDAVLIGRDVGGASEDAAKRGAEEMRQTIIALFARELSGTNPRFDVGRFVHACGVER